MNLSDELKQMQANGKSVVSISFILNCLRESHIDYNVMSDDLPLMLPNSVRLVTGRIVRGGD